MRTDEIRSLIRPGLLVWVRPDSARYKPRHVDAGILLRLTGRYVTVRNCTLCQADRVLARDNLTDPWHVPDLLRQQQVEERRTSYLPIPADRPLWVSSRDLIKVCTTDPTQGRINDMTGGP